jgi:hypothetical protein
MRLSRVARKFDNVVAQDAYGTDTFMVQYEPMSFSKIDGTSVTKRMVSAAPEIVMPARGAIKIDGMNYVVGHGAPDYWMGEVIRVSYVIQGATGLANLHSIASAIAQATPVTAYAALVFNKYMPEANDNSKYPPQYQVFLAGSESAPAESLVQLNGKWFLVKQSYISTSGLRIALANELDDPVFEVVTYGDRVYEPVSDTYTSTTSTVRVLRVKWSEHFHYLTASDETYQRGDIQIIAMQSDMPNVKPSDTLTLSDGVWRVLSVQDEGVTLSLHMRRS